MRLAVMLLPPRAWVWLALSREPQSQDLGFKCTPTGLARPAEALSSLGGGIRGLFRVDRSWKPRSALTAGGPAGTARSGAGWGTGGSSSGGGGGDGSTWTAVAASAPRPGAAQQAQQAPAPAEEGGGKGGGRWMVIGKAKKAPVGAGAAGAGEAGPSSAAAAGAAAGPVAASTSAPALASNTYLGLADAAWEE